MYTIKQLYTMKTHSIILQLQNTIKLYPTKKTWKFQSMYFNKKYTYYVRKQFTITHDHDAKVNLTILPIAQKSFQIFPTICLAYIILVLHHLHIKKRIFQIKEITKITCKLCLFCFTQTT